jgi:hypothetical protein
MTWSASTIKAERLKKVHAETFADSPCIELTFQCEDALGTQKNDTADNQVGIMGAGPCDKSPGKDNPQVYNHIIGRKYPTGFHVGTALTVFGDQGQTADIGNKGDRCDGHHHQ